MNVRSPRYNAVGTINLDLEHPIIGWIPFTASPDDVEEHGRVLYEKAVSGEFGDIAEYVPPPLLPEVPKMSPTDKLRDFLAANPDVMDMLK